MTLPPLFLNRMQTLLGAEYEAFLASYADAPHVGLRVNTLKLSPDDFLARTPFALEPLPWTSAGFRVLEGENRSFDAAQDRPGLHPYHAAGLYYLQEPSAQAVAEIFNPQPGERVLDLAAAPGGKTTHIAAKMQNKGVLLANEIHPKRVWDLAKNMERWGARNVVITHETPERLAEALPEFFDRVLVDAPCSGEGMFRKMPEAVRDWSPEFVAGCAVRQTNILNTAALLVRLGGWLGYATCTFAPEEDELVIARFLDEHPDFALVSPPTVPGFTPTSPASPYPLNADGPAATRLFPHRAPGEGHFIALLQHTPNQQTTQPTPHPTRPSFQPALQKLLPYWETFAHETLTLSLDPAQLRLIKSYLYALPPETPDLRGLNAIRPGWWLGSFKKDRFEPAHALAMALRPDEVQRTLPLTEPQALAFLRCETLRLPSNELPNGWTLVTLEDFPLGWGKVVNGVVKNHYPAGLRVT
ncbi:MAG: RsmF rRNA methyltransferase first C-terminal domain-containing protein [Anaerolineales bacterium]|nr:RsmF rRNA methyltransferase first C-terminal domain-containing protein [Anaerolineales bacterium]